jgi:membrane fusion protein, multidrug efflux system
VKQLQADLALTQAELERVHAESSLAESIFQQEKQIYKTDSTTQRRFLEAQQKHRATVVGVLAASQKVKHAEESLEARIGGEHALIAEVKAQLAEARLNLEYTRVHAPCDGRITDLQLREGAYVHIGQSALTLIDTQHWFVVANFRENALKRVRVGQPAQAAFQGEPGQLWSARVADVGWGVGQGQGVPSGTLPDMKRQNTWIPPAQRFQVRLELKEADAVTLRVGMTGSVTVYTEPEGPLNDVAEAIHHVLAWLYYL